MSALDGFLSRLDRVKSTGPDRWIASCPAHDDRNPSLTIREAEDGRVLVHCFAGCGAADVLSAVGMSFADLYPDRKGWSTDSKPRERKPFYAADVLRAIGDEVLIVATAAANLAHGMTLTDEDRERLMLAAERLQAAVSYGTA
jgi:hypothetical protein